MYINVLIDTDEIKISDTTEISSMKAEFYKLKSSLDSAMHLQDFLHSTNMANSLLTDTESLYVQATQLCDQMQEKQCQLTWNSDSTLHVYSCNCDLHT